MLVGSVGHVDVNALHLFLLVFAVDEFFLKTRLAAISNLLDQSFVFAFHPVKHLSYHGLNGVTSIIKSYLLFQ